MRKLILLLAALSIAALAAVGCGSENEAASGASELAPAGALVYGEATLDPEGEQEKAVDSIVSKFPGGDQAGAKLKELINKGLQEDGSDATFEDDIEPWLGDEIGFFIAGMDANGQPGSAVILLATDDEGEAEDALERTAEGEITRKEYKGTEYFMDEAEDVNTAAVFDGFVVAGNERGVRASIAAAEDDRKLSDDEGYEQAVEKASEDRIGLVYLNSPEFARSLPQGASLPPAFQDFFKEPVAATIDADDDGIVFESEVGEDIARTLGFVGQPSELMTTLPADSWLATAQTDFGKLIDFFVDSLAQAAGGRDAVERQVKAATGLDLQRDVIDWMGDFAIFARGTSVAELDGALLIETNDEQASRRFLDALKRLARTQAQGAVRIGQLSAPGGGQGFTASTGAIPKPIHVFQRGGRVVFAYGDAAATDAVGARDTLGDDPDFTSTRESLGDYDISSYILLGPIVELVDSTEAANDADWQDAKPYLEPLSALVAGTSGDGDSLKSAFKLVIK